MESKLQIFVSSTFKDLKEERQAAVEAILKAGHIPAGMELFTAGNKSQWEVIKEWILDSDVYMLILGGRYGSIEPESGLSYTELEYDFAKKSGKPYFAVVIDEGELTNRIKKFGENTVSELEAPDKLKNFRKKALKKMSSFFCDSKDIKLSIHESLPILIKENDIKGWIKASEVPDMKKYLKEMSELSSENKELRNQVTELEKISNEKELSKTNEKQEFEEIMTVFNSKKIDLSKIKTLNIYDLKLKNKSEVPLFVAVMMFKDSIIKGINYRFGISEAISFVYNNICPQLQTYKLVENINVKENKSSYYRYEITEKGINFFAFVEKRLHLENKP